jgi:demethylmenaquinone methyltransferase/2-methoxy-6-polyprenyl-1,4-benzoquinol methylase
MNPRDLRINDYLKTPAGHNTYNRELFSFIARRYDALTRGLSIGRDAKWKSRLIASLPDLRRPDCLDVGCGTGDLSLLLAERFPEGRVHGIDLTPAMVREARDKCAVRNVSFEVQDMCELKFSDRSFDIVTAGYAVRNAPDLRRALAEIRRVLRPGGTLGILEFSKPRGRLLQTLEGAVLRGWGAACGLLYYGDAWSCVSIPTTLKSHPDASGFESLLGETGFSAIRSTRFLLGITSLVLCCKQI